MRISLRPWVSVRSVLAIALVACAPAALAATQAPATRDVLEVYQRAMADPGGDGFLELHAIVLEGQASVAADAELDGEREAFIVASILLAANTEALEEPRPEPLALLRAACAAGDARVGSETRAWADLSFASELVSYGRLEEAEGVLRASLAGPALGSTNEMPIRSLFADVLRGRARWNEALAVLEDTEEVLALAEREQPSAKLSGQDRARREVAWADLYAGLAQVEQGLGRLDLASRALRKQRDYAERSGDPFTRGIALLNRCDFALTTEDFGYVEDVLGELNPGDFGGALRPDQLALFELYLGVARAEREIEGLAALGAAETLRAALADAALPRSERFVARRTLVHLFLGTGRISEAQAELERLRGELEQAEGIEQTLHERFLYTLESRLALARVQRGSPDADLTPHRSRMRASLDTLLREWERTPQTPGGLGLLHSSRAREVLGTLARLELRGAEKPEAGVEAALDHFLRAESMGTLARRLDLPKASLNELREELIEEGHGVLVYLAERDTSHVFGFDRHTAWHVALPRWELLRGPLEELSSALSGLAGTRPKERARRAARLDRSTRSVSELLFPALVQERVARWSHVTVLGTEHLRRLPVEALRFEDGTFLGEQLALDVLPSLTLGLHLSRRAREASSRHHSTDTGLILLATLDPGAEAARRWPGLQVRELARTDLETLCAPFGERVLLRVGREARAAELPLEALENARVVHLLAHGARLTDQERQAALLLAGDEESVDLLRCDDVEREVRVRGVVLLSACGTAQGPVRPGDDNLAHLGGAFLMAGAPAVALAQTRIELGVTLRLMEVVHRRLVAGDGLAEALRVARVELARADDPLSSYQAQLIGVVGVGGVPVY